MKKGQKKSAKGYTLNTERHPKATTEVWRADVNYNAVHLRKRFKTKTDAEAWAQARIVELQKEGTDADRLGREDKMDAAAAFRELGEDGGTLLDAIRELRLVRGELGTGRQLADALEEFSAARKVLGGRAGLLAAANFWAAHNPDGGAVALGDLAVAYRESLEKKGRSPGHLRAVREQLWKFVEKFGVKTPAAQIMEDDVKGYLDNLGGALRSRRYRLGTLKRLFQYGVREYKLPANPAANLVAEGKETVEEPTFYTVEEVEKLLRACEEIAPAFAPALAILFFAGVRPTELSGQYGLRGEYADPTGEVVGGLDWEQVGVGGDIVITEKVAKTSQRRRIPISPNLAAWLDRYGGARVGRVVANPQAWRRVRKAIVAASGVEWVQDGARHTFATYHHAMHQNRDLLEAAMGHGQSSTMLETHYKGLADKKAAARFWAIMPTGAAAPSKSKKGARKGARR